MTLGQALAHMHRWHDALDPAKNKTDRKAIEIVARHADRLVLTEEVLTSKEAMDYLKVGRTTLWNMIRKGEIAAYSVGTGRTSSHRFFKHELTAWLRKRRKRCARS